MKIVRPSVSSLVPFGFERFVTVICELRERRQVFEPVIVGDRRACIPNNSALSRTPTVLASTSHLRHVPDPLIHRDCAAYGCTRPNVDSLQGL
jgi:hypothetical protein